MKVEVYTSESEDSITVVPAGPKDEGTLPEDSILLREIEGDTWEDCMRQHHELMGWEPYVPFDS